MHTEKELFKASFVYFIKAHLPRNHKHFYGNAFVD